MSKEPLEHAPFSRFWSPGLRFSDRRHFLSDLVELVLVANGAGLGRHVGMFVRTMPYNNRPARRRTTEKRSEPAEQTIPNLETHVVNFSSGLTMVSAHYCGHLVLCQVLQRRNARAACDQPQPLSANRDGESFGSAPQPAEHRRVLVVVAMRRVA